MSHPSESSEDWDVTSLPKDLVAYHEAGKPLCCEIPVQPWGCEFWPLDEILEHNDGYMVPKFAPGYLGFATSGGGEMYAFSPSGRIVCLAFVGMSPKEELAVAETWREFESMLRDAQITTASQAIAAAEPVSSSVEIPDGEPDLYWEWERLLDLQKFVESDPEPLWDFARRWGAADDPDLRLAVATCLLQPLLERHFALLFPRVEAAVRADSQFADCFARCEPLGEVEQPENSRRFEALKAEAAAR